MRRHSDLHQSAAISAVLLVLLFALPLAVVVPFRTELFSDDPTAVESEREPFQPGDLDAEMVLKVLVGDTVEEMTLGEYLVGVVRAEMPASFEPEALKAQAVAARTYTLYKMQTGGNHGDTADICTDSTCCQAYISEENARNNWGDAADENEAKIETAVRETDGETILYGGVPILAVFHSCSAGRTRASGQVWVSDLPYLQAVCNAEKELEEQVNQLRDCKELLQKQCQMLSKADGELLRKVLAGEASEDPEGAALCQQVGRNRMLLERTLRADRMVSQRLGGSRSYYRR